MSFTPPAKVRRSIFFVLNSLIVSSTVPVIVLPECALTVMLISFMFCFSILVLIRLSMSLILESPVSRISNFARAMSNCLPEYMGQRSEVISGFNVIKLHIYL